MNGLLDMGDFHRVQGGPAGIFGEDFRQIHHLFLRLHIRVRITIEMQTFHVHAALCHHVPCHGAVNPPRKQKQALACRAYGHSVCPLDKLPEDKRAPMLANVHLNTEIGIVHVHFEFSFAVFQKHTAKRAADLHRRQRILLIAAVGFHLKRAFRSTEEFRRLEDGLQIGIRFIGDAERMQPEYLFQFFHDFFQLVLVEILHEITTDLFDELRIKPFQRTTKVGFERPFEKSPVLPLQKYLRIADNNHSFHGLFLPISFCDLNLARFHSKSLLPAPLLPPSFAGKS